MKKYSVVIEETISQEFEVDAESKDDAISKAIEKYQSGEFVLSPGNLESKKILIVDENSEFDDWIEF